MTPRFFWPLVSVSLALVLGVAVAARSTNSAESTSAAVTDSSQLLFVTDKNFTAVFRGNSHELSYERAQKRRGSVKLALVWFVASLNARDSSQALSGSDALRPIRDLMAAVERLRASYYAVPAHAISFSFGKCSSVVPAAAPTHSASRYSDVSDEACDTIRALGIDDKSELPTLVALNMHGTHLRSWGHVNLVHDPERAAAFVLRHVQPAVRLLHSLSDVLALMSGSPPPEGHRSASLASEVDVNEARPAVVFLASSHAPLPDIRSVGEMLRGAVEVYAAHEPDLYRALSAGGALCDHDRVDAENISETSSWVGAFIFRRSRASAMDDARAKAFVERRRAGDGVAASCENPLDRSISSQRHPHATVIRLGTPLLCQASLDEVLSGDAAERHFAGLQAIARRVAFHALSSVEIAVGAPSRDVLLSRSPLCTIVHFVPNLFNISHLAGDAKHPPRLPPFAAGHVVASHVSYYANRLRRMVALSPELFDRCAVTLVDPFLEKELFAGFGYKASDVYQTSAEIKSQQGKSFSGKSRDSLLAVVVNGTWRFRQEFGYFDAAKVKTFLQGKLMGTARSLQLRAAMRSDMTSSDGPSARLVVHPLLHLPWRLNPALEELVATEVHGATADLLSRWMWTVTYDHFDLLVVGNLRVDVVLLLVSSTTNVTDRAHGRDSVYLEALMSAVVFEVAARRPDGYRQLQFVRMAADCNDIPEVLLPHLPNAREPLRTPYVFYLARAKKYQHVSKHPRNFHTHPILGSPRPMVIAPDSFSTELREVATPVSLDRVLGQRRGSFSSDVERLRLELERVAGSSSQMFASTNNDDAARFEPPPQSAATKRGSPDEL